jgi:hypothetical protein
MYANRRVVVRRVVAMSHCRSVQIEELAYKPSDSATSWQRAAIWRATLEIGLQDDSPTTNHLALCRVVASNKTKRHNDIDCVVAIGNATRNVPNQPPYLSPFRHFSKETHQTSPCRTVVLLLAKYTKWRVVDRRVVTMSPCHFAFIYVNSQSF